VKKTYFAVIEVGLAIAAVVMSAFVSTRILRQYNLVVEHPRLKLFRSSKTLQAMVL
jgi:hypothetical protein